MGICPCSSRRAEAVRAARFNTEVEFNAFLDGLFAGRKVVLAAADDFVITSKSDGILVPPAETD